MGILRAGIVGLGWWGRTIVTTLAGSEVVRITDATDIDARAATFANANRLAFAENLEALLADPAIDGVILCTPHSLHATQIAAVAAAGKHVFCEKPLCLTLADAVASIAACNRAGVTLGLGHERRFEPPMIELRRLVTSGALGTPLQIEANFSQDKFLSLPAENWRLSNAEAPAGPMTATGIHLLDLGVSLLGPAASAMAQVRQLGSPMVNGDTLGVLLNFRSGANALLSAILATPFDGRFAVYGSEGWAEVRDKAHPEAPAGWTLTLNLRATGRGVREFSPAPAVRAIYGGLGRGGWRRCRLCNHPGRHAGHGRRVRGDREIDRQRPARSRHSAASRTLHAVAATVIGQRLTVAVCHAPHQPEEDHVVASRHALMHAALEPCQAVGEDGAAAQPIGGRESLDRRGLANLSCAGRAKRAESACW